MAAERDFELLDDYLSNRLSGEEKSAFEKTLEADGELNHELQLQQKLIEGIRNARVAGLKTMLNNTPIPPTQAGGAALFTKAAVWLSVAGLVGTGLYFFFKNDEPSPVIQPSVLTLEQKKDVPAETHPQPNEEKSAIAEDNTSAKEEKKSKSSAKKKKKLSVETSKVDQPKLDVYDPTKEVEFKAAEPRIEVEVSAKTSINSHIAVTLDNTNKKYTFHYQFKEGKLLLYGTFQKNLYEILEFFSNEKRTIFLFYKSNYYLLEQNDDKIKALSPIKDPVLLNKLKNYRGH